MYLFMYIYIFIYIYMCIHINILTYVYLYVYIYIYIYICKHVFFHARNMTIDNIMSMHPENLTDSFQNHSQSFNREIIQVESSKH